MSDAHRRPRLSLTTTQNTVNAVATIEASVSIPPPASIGSERGGRARNWFSEHAPDAHVIVPGNNTGYAGGNALGMQRALEEGAEYVAIVTQDTYLEPDWLRELVDVAQSRPRAGAVQPKIMRRDDKGDAVIHTRGNELHFLGVGFVGGDGEPDRELDVVSICYASGAGVLYRSAALRDVGVFDPALFMYHEDSDLGWRLRLAAGCFLRPGRHASDYDFARAPASPTWSAPPSQRLHPLRRAHAPASRALPAPLEPVTLAYGSRAAVCASASACTPFSCARAMRYLAQASLVRACTLPRPRALPC